MDKNLLNSIFQHLLTMTLKNTSLAILIAIASAATIMLAAAALPATGTLILVTLNKVAFVPSTVNMARDIQYPNGTDVSYAMTGNEDTVSSDIVFPTEEDLMTMFAQMFTEEFVAENITQTEEPAMAESNATETEEVQTFLNVDRFSVHSEV